MILQELIRNYILYREVLKPVLTSWRDSFTSGYNRKVMGMSSTELSLAFKNAAAGGDGEELGWDISDEYEAKSINRISGTHTIAINEKPSWSTYDLFYRAITISDSALGSREDMIVLTGSRVYENAANIGKTTLHDYGLITIFIASGSNQSTNATTGFENKQINSILISETHEKREYLGEFSLTHEETPFMYQLEGGDYHELN